MTTLETNAYSLTVTLCETVDRDGFAVIPNVFASVEMESLSAALGDSVVHRSRAGMRHLMRISEVAAFAGDDRLISIASEILGASAIPFRATLFDKSPHSNWLVAWHQDTALPLKERREVTGWGPWSVKEGIHYSHAPTAALKKVVALRIHFDDSTAENGPLRVLPGTHAKGVLTDDEVHEVAENSAGINCLVAAGGVIAMRPSLIHASSKAKSLNPRRVLHIEYALSLAVGGGLELVVA